MIQRMLAGGLIAGFAAGLFAATLHFAFIQKLILLGEQYETGTLVHFAGASGVAPAAPHDHDGSHDHAAGGTGGGDGHDSGGAMRNVLTVLFTGFTYASYGLILVAAFAVAERMGQRIDLQRGLLWGLAAYLTFQLAPAMGLPPELPGSVAADITERQIWYFGTVAATAAGLALIVSGRGIALALAGAALIGLPHAIGAPQPDGFSGVTPPELAAEFSARVLGMGFATWAVLGALAGWLWSKDAR